MVARNSGGGGGGGGGGDGVVGGSVVAMVLAEMEGKVEVEVVGVVL